MNYFIGGIATFAGAIIKKADLAIGLAQLARQVEGELGKQGEIDWTVKYCRA